jgi:hypothetical protein
MAAESKGDGAYVGRLADKKAAIRRTLLAVAPDIFFHPAQSLSETGGAASACT